MHDLNVLMTFAGGLTATPVPGYLAQRLKLSPNVDYVLAGVAVGPFTPGFVHQEIATEFASGDRPRS